MVNTVTKKRPSYRLTDLRKMGRKRARVLIAKDALALLKKEALMACAGGYLVIRGKSFPFSVDDEDEDKQVADIVSEAPVCEVCAIGAAFVASVRRFDRLKIRDFYADPDRYDYTRYLGQFFSQAQLDLMEIAFEGTHIGVANVPEREFLRAQSFYLHYATPERAPERLEAIFRNIVKNDGTFKP